MSQSETPESEISIPTPRENPYFAGHQAAEAEILDAYASGRFPHAWLICGPRGVGKASLAYRMARFLLSSGPSNADLFGESAPPNSLDISENSPVFRQIAANGHPDLKCLERRPDETKQGQLRNEITVDEPRELGRFLSLTAIVGGWRVVIIDSVDDMNRNAANALLKPLEDPPKKSVLILVSHNPGRLLATIRSRCRRLNLKPLADEVMAALIERYLPETSPEDAAELVRLSQGSIGQAIALGEKEGIALCHEVMTLLEGLPELDMKGLEKLANNLTKSEQKEAFNIVVHTLYQWSGEQIKQRLGQTNGLTNLDRWLEVWENLERLFGRAAGLDLDRKQVIVNAFLTVQSVTRS